MYVFSTALQLFGTLCVINPVIGMHLALAKNTGWKPQAFNGFQPPRETLPLSLEHASARQLAGFSSALQPSAGLWPKPGSSRLFGGEMVALHPG